MSKGKSNMTTKKHTSSTTVVLSIIVMLAGGAAVAVAVAKQAVVAEHAWLMMIALALLVAPMSAISIPSVKARVVLGDVVTFSCAALFGPSAAVIAAAVDGAVTSLRITKSPHKFSYNVAVCAVSMTAAGFIAKAAFPGFGLTAIQMPLAELVGAMGLFALCYFLISTVL